jgi:hypothetical protein
LLEAGAKPLLTMEQRDPQLGFVTPAIIDVTNCTICPTKNTSARCCNSFAMRTFDEAIERANDTAFGLSAGLLADDEAVDAFPAHHSRRYRQLEPADQRRVVRGAVRRHGTLGQQPSERVLRSRLLRVSDGLRRKRATANARERVAGPSFLRIDDASH